LKKNLGGKMKLIAREEFIDGVKRVYKNTPEDEIKYDMYLRVLQELSKQQVSIKRLKVLIIILIGFDIGLISCFIGII
jgi:hypothetical protein